MHLLTILLSFPLTAMRYALSSSPTYVDTVQHIRKRLIVFLPGNCTSLSKCRAFSVDNIFKIPAVVFATKVGGATINPVSTEIKQRCV